MTTITSLSATWRQWIQDNLARGCSHASLVESMVRENFEPAFAFDSVHKLAYSSSAPVAPQEPFMYEPPRMQTRGSVVHCGDREVRLTFMLTQPVVALLDNLLSAEECEELVHLSRIKLQRSTIVDPETGREMVIKDRSSDGTFFALNENAFIAKLDHRIAEVMSWPIENGEGLQILRYSIGGEYKPHFDYFPPSDPGSQAHLAKGGQRVSTLVMYLNDVQAGGETIFPELKLSVTPKKGSAVYFEYCNSRGQIDPQTLHGGLPVAAGEKWIATKWMREKKFG